MMKIALNYFKVMINKRPFHGGFTGLLFGWLCKMKEGYCCLAPRGQVSTLLKHCHSC